MSIELNWETLTSGPDGDALAERIRAFIHDKFQSVPLPRFINSANGTKYWLDIHKGNPPFMNNSVVENGDKGEDSQHWYISSAQAVNAIEYSTISTIVCFFFSFFVDARGCLTGKKRRTNRKWQTPTSTQSTTATTTSTSDPAATTSSTNEASSGGLSSGAQAGIGISVGIAVVALGVAALFLWRRRRPQQQEHHTPAASSIQMSPSTPRGGGGGSSSVVGFNSNKPLPPIEKKTYCELPDADTASSYNNVGYHEPQELPTTTAPPPKEVHVERYELDSTPVTR
ncbi:hypothetical protein NLG97_g4852 [Lecanicillium saksenae]|uniref:Uncharacterized protein n=1 Tax=Lecanicillium saksenae TaxID=468837 RepID=A0ACC1QU99_9HYPO|nr:hypothetical protein NLG97_g4852 [Lecanicillium saksenae]